MGIGRIFHHSISLDYYHYHIVILQSSVNETAAAVAQEVWDQVKTIMMMMTGPTTKLIN